MSSRVGKVRLGPRVVQPQGFLGRGQLVSLEETLEQQVTPLPQVRQATVGHLHPRTLSALAVRRNGIPQCSCSGSPPNSPSGQTPSPRAADAPALANPAPPRDTIEAYVT